LQGYTWTEYDSREGGVQVINDLANNVQITTEFLKIPGGDHGGRWAVRIKGKPMVESEHIRFTASTPVIETHFQPGRPNHHFSFTSDSRD